MTKKVNVCSYASVEGKNAKGVDALIKAAVQSSKTMRERVQQAAVAVLLHAHKHGDYRKANDLVHGLGNGVNGKALVEWFGKYGGLSSENGKEFDGWKGADFIREQFQEAKSNAWWECAKQNPWQGFDLQAEIKKLLKKQENAAKKIAEARESANDEEVAELEGKYKSNDETVKALRALVA